MVGGIFLVQMYLTKHKIERNWRVEDISPPDRLKILKGHDDHVVCVRKMKELMILSLAIANC